MPGSWPPGPHQCAQHQTSAGTKEHAAKSTQIMSGAGDACTRAGCVCAGHACASRGGDTQGQSVQRSLQVQALELKCVKSGCACCIPWPQQACIDLSLRPFLCSAHLHAVVGPHKDGLSCTIKHMKLCSTAQHSTAQHSTAQHSTAQHSTAQHIAAQHSKGQRSNTYSAPSWAVSA
jgi:hypothetical protein